MFIFFLNGWWAFALFVFASWWTASDYTMYPFSTQNGKDFQNLLSVYLDAVFFPCLREQDFRWVVTIAAQFYMLKLKDSFGFSCDSYRSHTKSAAACLILCVFISRQEGWRLENENPTDPNTPLVFKGVVFNEMKGAFVSQHSLSLSLRLH